MSLDINDTLFQVPEIVSDTMYQKVTRIQNSDLTSGVVGGTGIFDALMASVKAHLKAEFDASRITGGEYTKAYIELVSAAMQTSTQVLLGRDQAFWQAQQAQIEAITARTNLEKVRLEFLVTQYNLENIMPLQLAQMTLQNTGEGIRNSIASYNLATMLPLQSAQLTLQNTGEGTKNSIAAYNLATILPLQSAQLTLQNAGESIKNDIETYTLGTDMPLKTTLYNRQNAAQQTQNDILSYNLGTMMPQQFKLLKEQTEVQYAQTQDVRTDLTTTVVGLIGKQKDLYTQQVTSYKRDAETKVAKLYSDAFITQKTIDEGLLPPTNFTNTTIDSVLTTLKTNVGF